MNKKDTKLTLKNRKNGTLHNPESGSSRDTDCWVLQQSTVTKLKLRSYRSVDRTFWWLWQHEDAAPSRDTPTAHQWGRRPLVCRGTASVQPSAARHRTSSTPATHDIIMHCPFTSTAIVKLDARTLWPTTVGNNSCRPQSPPKWLSPHVE